MTRSRRARSGLLILVAPLLLSACGDDKPSAASIASSPSCQLLTPERAASFISDPTLNVNVSPAQGSSVCIYNQIVDGKLADTIALFMLGDNTRFGASASTEFEKRENVTAVAGLADIAIVGPTSIEWLKGQLTYEIQLNLEGRDPAAEQRAALLEMAKTFNEAGPETLGAKADTSSDTRVCEGLQRIRDLVATATATNSEARQRVGWGPDISEADAAATKLLDGDTGSRQYLVQELYAGVRAITLTDTTRYDAAVTALNAVCSPAPAGAIGGSQPTSSAVPSQPSASPPTAAPIPPGAGPDGVVDGPDVPDDGTEGTQAAAIGEYRAVSNSRFGFTCDVPATFDSVGESANRDGLAYTSPDGSARVSCFGANNIPGVGSESPQDLLAQTIAQFEEDNTSVTYKVLKGNIVTVSGFMPSGDIYYERSAWGPGSTNTLSWTYPAADKTLYDVAVTHTVRAFRAGDLSTSG